MTDQKILRLTVKDESYEVKNVAYQIVLSTDIGFILCLAFECDENILNSELSKQICSIECKDGKLTYSIKYYVTKHEDTFQVTEHTTRAIVNIKDIPRLDEALLEYVEYWVRDTTPMTSALISAVFCMAGIFAALRLAVFPSGNLVS